MSCKHEITTFPGAHPLAGLAYSALRKELAMRWGKEELQLDCYINSCIKDKAHEEALETEWVRDAMATTIANLVIDPRQNGILKYRHDCGRHPIGVRLGEPVSIAILTIVQVAQYHMQVVDDACCLTGWVMDTLEKADIEAEIEITEIGPYSADGGW